MHRVMLALFGLALLRGGDVFAQETFPTLNAGTTLRVNLADGSTHEGQLLSLSAGQLVLAANGDRGLATSEIDSLWVRHRATSEGARNGALVLGGASLALGTVACLALADENGGCQSQHWVGIASLSVVGAIAGGSIGALIGTAFSKWDLRYTRDPGTAGVRRGWALTLRMRTGPSQFMSIQEDE